MGLADELLEDLSSDIETREDEDHIVIGADRYITVPEALKKIAVQYDHNIETVSFICPRFWDELDMSKMRIYVNYIRADDEPGCDLVTNITVNGRYSKIMQFDWTITGHLTAVAGPITILVCIQNVGEDGVEKNHWNSEINTDLYISKGLECETNVIDHYPGIITALLSRMDYVEEIATPENMMNYVQDYFDNHPDLPDVIKSHIYNYMASNYDTSEEVFEEYVTMYLEDHPLFLAIGPNKPGRSCLWFNTSQSEEITENITTNISAETDDDRVYASVGEKVADTTEYDYTIK